MRNRGLTYWQEGSDKRIFVGYRNRLYALDANSGQPIKSFGERAGQQGWIDLRQNLGREQIDGLTIALPTPGVIYQDTIIIGSLVSEGLPALPGDIRAYDVRTGKLRWSFHTIPQPGEFGAETWPKDARQYLGGANNWAGMVVDQKRVWSLLLLAQRHSTFTARIGAATTSSPTRCSASTRRRVSASGTFRRQARCLGSRFPQRAAARDGKAQ